MNLQSLKTDIFVYISGYFRPFPFFPLQIGLDLEEKLKNFNGCDTKCFYSSAHNLKSGLIIQIC